MNIVYVLGNPDLPDDSLAIKILPRLRKKFPQVKFQLSSPEELPKKSTLWLLDCAFGIEKSLLITDLNQIARTSDLSVHGFDLSHELGLRRKLKLLDKVFIIALPAKADPKRAAREAVKLFSASGF